MGASHLEHATLSPPSLPLTLFVNLCPTKRVNSGPSLYFWKYNCFSLIYMCIDWFSIDISDESDRPIPGVRVRWAIFSPKTNSYGNLGPSFQASLLLRVSEPIAPSWILNSPSDWLKITSAILDLENNRVYCSRNNSLLSFSAPDWLLLIWARYSNRGFSNLPVPVRTDTLKNWTAL